MPELQECPHCEIEVSEGALFCHLCGGEVAGDFPRDPQGRLRERLSRALGDRYRLHDVLGKGGMGVVFLADDLEQGRRVAIKVLSPELAADASIVARFAREARTAAGLDHPGIVRIFDAASARGLDYFVMQYVEGRSLADVLRDEPRVSISFATRVLREAAAALVHAHRQGIVHRDVKPENIMLDKNGRVLLADFGISKFSGGASGATTMVRLTETGGVVGTPHYMAPEHALGQTVDGRADQYALAVLGFQMLAGQLPFDDETSVAVIHLHINTAAPRLSSLRPDVPPHLEAAIARAMSKSPAHRFPTMEEFAAAVAAPTATRRRLASWAAVLLIACGVTGGVWWLTNGEGRGRPRSAAAAPATRQTVRLSVTSAPNATVFVDGRRIGVTPIAGHQLTGGREHYIRLERKGYRTKRDTVLMTGPRTVRRSYVLQRSAR